MISNIASGIADRTISGPTDIALDGLDSSTKRSLHAFINRQYNFLKHADTDALSSLAEEDINLFFAVSRACVLFQDIHPKVDIEEVYLFKYLTQRKNELGFSPDVEPYPSTFDAIDDVEIEKAILNYLEFEV